MLRETRGLRGDKVLRDRVLVDRVLFLRVASSL
jgi:hypothetical protein